MTTEPDWKPSEEMVDAACSAYILDDISILGTEAIAAALIAARPLIIAEAAPGIEAAERERVRVLEKAAEIAESFDSRTGHSIAYEIRALKAKP